MNADEERQLWHFLDWLRTQGLAVCDHGRDPEGRWRPIAESAGTLLERYGAYRLSRMDDEQES